MRRIETARLLLRMPVISDAPEIYSRYASDPDVTKYLSWPMHRSVEDTLRFLSWSEAEWQRSAAGPYLIESREEGVLLGSTGLGFETASIASTGYVLARDAWGRGYATEALTAMVEVARSTGVGRLFADCHPENAASIRVLSKCGFALESDVLVSFPNLQSGEAVRALRFVLR